MCAEDFECYYNKTIIIKISELFEFVRYSVRIEGFFLKCSSFVQQDSQVMISKITLTRRCEIVVDLL